MKKILFFLLLPLVFIFSKTNVLAQKNDGLYFFYGNGCPHCSIVEKYLEENDLYEKLKIEKKEIYFNKENTLFFNNIMDDLGINSDKRGVPTLVNNTKVIVGDTPIINYLKTLSNSNPPTPTALPTITPEQQNLKQKTDLTILAVIGASLVDAINPCAFAVLIILVSTVLATGNSKKALKSGLFFSLSIFISYFLMGIGIYKALGVGNISGMFFKIVGWLAIILGLFNLKDFFWYGRGFLMEVPLSWRPKLKSIISSVTNPLGAFSIGFLISLFLLPCTSGPYIVILGMLAKKTTQFTAITYLLLYNFIFIFPMILISWLVYKGFDPKKAEEIRQKRLGVLHLIAGLVLLVMGFVIIKGWI